MELFKTIPILFFIASEFSYVTLENVESSTIKDLEIDDRIICTNAKCIMKCCPFGKYVTSIKRKDQIMERICSYFDNNTRDLASTAKDIFYKYPEISKLNLTVKSGIFEANETFKMQSVILSGLFNVYLTEYPDVYMELPNAYNRWTRIPNDKFCWDYKIEKNKISKEAGFAETTSSEKIKPWIWGIIPDDATEPNRTSSALLTTGMLVTCFFLLVVLVVYTLLPELQNLCGQILMAYVASLFTAFLLLAILRIQLQDVVTCQIFTFLIYYFFLVSFCWMHVMSYDIWWTFRGYARARPIHRRGERFKFLMYCLYAFGVPLAMTIAFIVVDTIDMSNVPWFITPNVPQRGCFIEGGEKFLYLYIPMLILILCNWVFYLMTAYNVWRLSRGTAVLDTSAAGTPQAHRTHRDRFLVYLKLSAVMGLNWIMEVVSSLFPGYSVWFICDFYNILIGVTIFLIFVCKRKILKKLVKRYLRWKSEWQPGQKNSRKSTSLNSDGSCSLETQMLQVCPNPKGHIYTKVF